MCCSVEPFLGELNLSQPSEEAQYQLVKVGYRLHNVVGALKKVMEHILET